MVREYQGVKFLSTAKENSEIEETDDVGPVKEKEEVEGGSSTTSSLNVKDGRVVGMLDLESYHICMKCKGKVLLDEDDEAFGQRIKCKMSQCVEACKKHLTAQMMIAAGPTRITQ